MGGACFSVKHGHMPEASFIPDATGVWQASGVFYEATCAEGKPGPGQERALAELHEGLRGPVPATLPRQVVFLDQWKP